MYKKEKKGATVTGAAPFIAARRGGQAVRGSHATGVGGTRPVCSAGVLSPETGEVGVADKWIRCYNNGRR
jgi:hypothetical protein